MKKEQKNTIAVFHDGENGKILEVRASENPEDVGIVEAYLTAWDTVDSWNTSFKKGAFKKTFSTRGAKGTRLIWNHHQLAGKVLELKEDSYGPMAKVQFNLNTNAGKEAYEHVRAGDIPCFSFGFNTIKDRWNGQVREILEIDMLECGPVIFEANSKATIIDVRSLGTDSDATNGYTGQIERVCGKIETRETDFDDTQKRRELQSRGWQLQSSLEYTLEDIYYQSVKPEADEIIGLVDIAIAKFHTAYITWLNEYYAQFENRKGKAPCEFRNKLQIALNSVNKDDLLKSTSLTQEELKQLSMGHLLPLESRSKVKEAGEEIFSAFKETRSQYIEGLCDELRYGDLTDGEVERIEALLARRKTDNTEIRMALEVLKEFRAKL